MKRFALFLLGLLATVQVHAACTSGNCPPSSLPAASALTGTESIPADQSGSCSATGGTCQTTPAALSTYIGANTTLSSLSQLPSEATSTILCNNSGSSAAPTACNPLAVANILSAVIAVQAAATTNITLSGLGTPVDGVSLIAGQPVLAGGQTTSSQNGIYIAASGAWTRAVNFPAGYVISLNCQLQVFVSNGSAHKGHTFSLTTSGGPITIGTTAQTWADSTVGQGNKTALGTTYLTSGNSTNPAAVLIGTPVANDCVSFQDTAGDISDFGLGPCPGADASFHYSAAATSIGTPVVTGTGCSLVTGGTSNSGAITATGADTCTLTFDAVFDKGAPSCAVGGESATVLPFISTRPTTTAVIFKTAAAGTFEYICL